MTKLVSEIKLNARNRGANEQAGLRITALTVKLVVRSIDHFRSTNDWTCLAWIIALANGSDRKRLADIIEASCGVKFRADPKQPTGLRIAVRIKDLPENNNIALLEAYADNNFSYRSKAFTEGFSVDGRDYPALLEDKPAKVRTHQERLAAAIRACMRDNPDTATKARLTADFATALAAEFAAM